MKKPFISVIVPVYNVRDYLRRCIESVLMQEEKDFELLLVDDGSTDGSEKICDEYASKDERVRVFHKANGGVSSARNVGLDNARGVWVAFVDADDEVTADYLTVPQRLQEADVIVKGFIVRNGTSENHREVAPIELHGRKEIDRWFIRNRNNALWDKLIKREIIGDDRFDTNISIGEDFILFASILMRVNTAVTCACGYYIYIRRENSAMSLSDGRRIINVCIYNCRALLNICANNNIPDVGRSISAQHYLPLLTRQLQDLSDDDIDEVNILFRKTGFFNLQSLSFKERIRYIISFFRFLKWKLRKR